MPRLLPIVVTTCSHVTDGQGTLGWEAPAELLSVCKEQRKASGAHSQEFSGGPGTITKKWLCDNICSLLTPVDRGEVTVNLQHQEQPPKGKVALRGSWREVSRKKCWFWSLNTREVVRAGDVQKAEAGVGRWEEVFCQMILFEICHYHKVLLFLLSFYKKAWLPNTLQFLLLSFYSMFSHYRLTLVRKSGGLWGILPRVLHLEKNWPQ